MSYRPIPLNKFRKLLKKLGLIKMRTKGSHEAWNFPEKPLSRPVIFRATKKEVPAFHLDTISRTLGISLEELYRKLEDL